MGRLVAHAAHAAVAGLLDKGTWKGSTFSIDTAKYPELEYWVRESFTKVACKAWGKEELEEIAQEAALLEIPVSRIEEEGYLTAISLGPSTDDLLDHFKYLPLL